VSKDRSISGATATNPGAFPSGRGASASRLPTAPRERKPALAALAVLLILAGALSTMLLVTRSGNRVEVVMMKRTLTVGQRINPDTDFMPVTVAADNTIKYVKWDQRYDPNLKGRTTYNTLVQGSIMLVAMLGEPTASSAPAGTTVVGVQVKHWPYENLFLRDTVTVMGNAAGAATSSTPTNGGQSNGGLTVLGTAQIFYISAAGDTRNVTLAAKDDVAQKIALAGDSIILIKAIG
jgi:hypothetical protein